ncbi:EAL domain-containing protein [Pigmentiphaga soli]|uniref:EAL domain-containing protein n=1 Tax=Pigmentiphaga soli TaxID=1007095 RepID=A0ABP8HMG6_9BURK
MQGQRPEAAGHEDAEAAFTFLPEAAASQEGAGGPELIVLTVDDDAEFQRSIRLALDGFRFQGAPVRLLAASSAAEAAQVLAAEPCIAVMILDVVMETDDAGLRMVKSVREVLGNAEIRIVLVTGQPGMSSMRASLDQLDISDYWLKTDLTQARLLGILTANLRTWEQIRALGRARRGLQVIAEASNNLIRARGLADFSQRMMAELCRLLHLEPEGIVCVQEAADGDPLDALIVGASGQLAANVSQRLSTLSDERIRGLLRRSLAERTGIESEASQVLFFSGGESPRAAVYLATGRPLDPTERELLRVFSSNINSGLINVSLTSRLDRIAYEDPLLGIPNANALLRHVEIVLDTPGPRNRTLLLLDLDQYSAGSLSLGIEQGDLMLKKMARRLRSVFPPPSIVARLHDDTFAVLGHSRLLRPECIVQLESLDPEDPTHPPFISIGAGRLDLDLYQGSARGAMAMASLLLKRARSQGLSQWVDYQPGIERETDQRFTRSRELYHALHGNEIGIEFQPQIELATGRIVAAEALARWTRPNGVRIPPAEFIPMAEANGLIVPLGQRVLELACRAVNALDAAGFPGVPIAVNVSALQLAQRDFVARLQETIARYGVAPGRIEIELTESAAMGNWQGNSDTLLTLRQAGFPIAIDDFGTGYSSLGYLRTLPATTLKVDRCFVDEIGVIPENRTIADMVIRLGRQFDMLVVAEGVETPEQLAWLKAHGCPRAQGYLFGRPDTLDAFIARLRA